MQLGELESKFKHIIDDIPVISWKVQIESGSLKKWDLRKWINSSISHEQHGHGGTKGFW